MTRVLLLLTFLVVKFEVATIKPSEFNGRTPFGSGGCRGVDSTQFPAVAMGRCQFKNASLGSLILRVHPPASGDSIRLPEERIAGGPRWIYDSFFDIEAKAENIASVREVELREMLGVLLKEKFKLTMHKEMRQLDGFALLVSDDGFKLKERGSVPLLPMSQLRAQNSSIGFLATTLASELKSPVVDQTGIAGKYDIPRLTNSDQGSLFTSLQERTGLKLEAQKIAREFIVIDRVEKMPQ
jgi:uncharacterized protein (TIGR03435 family)